ncbi:carboxymuconolactone decarboxylase family protein [Paenibacillus sp. YPG26]|uniref:carboxymuconolactone decarboxylase family protein n=1 Tax=Paenibacillus sp. YPG26 TaxID=2878915 RepID=UPI0020412AFE|nr:carboxymuconolactone decarboxylase family protein [Paenibacillus sp. YPG26]USB35158.1 carboxymuconolactone decarboxylase family protein [Paenibacillus sp. YPG26]
MSVRFNYRKVNSSMLEAMLAFEQAVSGSGVDKVLYELIKIRASQINGCAYCIDYHVKDLLQLGEPVERALMLSVWKEMPTYSDKEKAALELTEYVTRISEAGVPQDVYERVREHFSEKEYIDLVMAVNAICSWNRIAISTGMYPGCFD